MARPPQEQQALAPITDEPQALTRATSEQNTMARLLELAIDKNVPVEALEKLVTLNERIAARNAASEFASAMARFQERCPPIKRTSTANVVTKSGARFSYNYAELDEIAKTVGPLLHSEGLSFTWDSTVDKAILRCVCTLRHVNGHSISASFECPTTTDAGMSEAQKVAAALTFARRMSLVSVLGLTTADADDDGTDYAERNPINASQAADLRALIEEVGFTDMGKLWKYAGANRIEDIPADKYQGVVRAVQARRAGK